MMHSDCLPVLAIDSCIQLINSLDPLRSPLRRFKWISKVECFMGDFIISELHDAYDVD